MKRRTLLAQALAIGASMVAADGRANDTSPEFGDSGSGTFKSLWHHAIPERVEALITTGYASPGDGGHGRYRAVSTQPRFPGSYFRSLDGRYWVYVPDPRGVNARAFGALADGAVDSSFRFSGVDNAPMIQGAIDFATYSAKCPIYLPAGRYRIADALQLGYGIGLSCTVLEGDGFEYRADARFSGSALLCDFSDRPGLAVNGARGTRVRRLALLGANFNWIRKNALGDTVSKRDDTQLESWIDPALSRDANGQHTPYSGIAIDPYSGRRPSPSYPAVAYPPWTDVPVQYGKDYSSNVVIDDVYIAGFVAALAIQPCDADGNGDFVKLEHVTAEMCVYAISAGNSQGRVVTADSCAFSNIYQGVVNTVHGRQQGCLEFAARSTSWERMIQIVHIADAPRAGPFTFTECHSENLFQIGVFGSNANGNNTITFQGHSFLFNLQTEARGLPALVFAGGDYPSAIFAGCLFTNYPSVLKFGGDAKGFRFDGCVIEVEPRTLPYEQIAMNFLGGGFVFAPNQADGRPDMYSVKADPVYNVDTGVHTVDYWSRYSVSDRTRPLCSHLAYARPLRQQDYELLCPRLWSVLNKSDLITFAIRNGALDLEFSSRTDASFHSMGPLPGDVLIDGPSQTVFFVRAREGNRVIAELETNFKVIRGVRTHLVPVTSAGALYVGNARVFMPEYYLRGDISQGSPVITNLGRADGFSAWIGADKQILPGDYLHIDERAGAWFDPEGARVVAVEADGKTITMAGGAVVSELRAALALFVRDAVHGL